MPSGNPSPNHILSRLSRADFRLLEPHLETIDLPVRRQLEARNKRVEHVYFMESGFASVVANGERNIEVGIIGREGMSGLSVVLGSDERPANETYIQIAGQGQRIAAGDLRDAIGASVSLHQVMLTLRAHVHGSDLADRARQRTQQDRGTPGTVAADGGGSRRRRTRPHP